MDPHSVFIETPLPGKKLSALHTQKWFFLRVNHFVFRKVGLVGETFATLGTYIRLLSCVDDPV